MKTHLRNQLGITLIEVLISLGVTSFLTVIIMPFIYRQMEEFESEKMSMARISLQLQVERYLSNPNIKGFAVYTLDADANLKNCVMGTGTCQQVANQGFSLYDSAQSVISGPSAANPARYDKTGAPCAGGPRCVFEIFTSYSTICENNAPSCQQAMSVTAVYTIQQSATANTGTTRQMRPIQSPLIPIQRKQSNVPPFRVTSYNATGALGVHQLCMMTALRIGASCALTGSYNTNWTLSGGSCESAVCFDFL